MKRAAAPTRRVAGTRRRVASMLCAGSTLCVAGALTVVATEAPAAAAAPFVCAATVFAPAGKLAARTVRRGPGLVLSGAGAHGMPPAALVWMRAHFGSPRGRAGNVVVLSASGGRDDTDAFYRDGRFASVQEITIPPCVPAARVDALAAYVNRADAVFFAGGDQSHYVRWKGSALAAAVRRVYARGGIVGGGSAGLAIQGAVAYDSVAADRLHPGDDYAVTTQNALRDPLEPEISFTRALFAWPALARTITDSHFVARDRFGRLVAFLALLARDGRGSAPFYGLGIDEGSVVLVEPRGTAILRKRERSRGAYLVRLGAEPALEPGVPLRATVEVARVGRDGERFDLLHRAVAGDWRTVTVDGARARPYDVDPYR